MFSAEDIEEEEKRNIQTRVYNSYKNLKTNATNSLNRKNNLTKSLKLQSMIFTIPKYKIISDLPIVASTEVLTRIPTDEIIVISESTTYPLESKFKPQAFFHKFPPPNETEKTAEIRDYTKEEK